MLRPCLSSWYLSILKKGTLADTTAENEFFVTGGSFFVNSKYWYYTETFDKYGDADNF